jgi:hypothetical protein
MCGRARPTSCSRWHTPRPNQSGKHRDVADDLFAPVTQQRHCLQRGDNSNDAQDGDGSKVLSLHLQTARVCSLTGAWLLYNASNTHARHRSLNTQQTAAGRAAGGTDRSVVSQRRDSGSWASGGRSCSCPSLRCTAPPIKPPVSRCGPLASWRVVCCNCTDRMCCTSPASKNLLSLLVTPSQAVKDLLVSCSSSDASLKIVEGARERPSCITPCRM